MLLLSPTDIDVCHRLGSQPRCPIIIRFISKSARYNFFSQRWRLKEIDTSKINYDELPVVTPRGQQNTGRGGHQSTKYLLRGRNSAGGGDGAATHGESEPHSIFMQEHLTKHTKDLLTATKTALTELRFEYPGYIKDGEVRAKREGTDKPILIRSHTDIKKIKDSDLSE